MVISAMPMQVEDLTFLGSGDRLFASATCDATDYQGMDCQALLQGVD